MILGAAVLLSAVAWTFLSPIGQALLLAGVVLVLGIITVAVKRRVPTTSTILAGLTAAVAVVVALGLPTLLPDLPMPEYAIAVAVGLNVLLLAAGRLGGVVLWRHLGWAATPLTAAVTVYALVAPDLVAAPQWPVAALLLAVAAVGLDTVGASQCRRDTETAMTAGWAGLATTVLVLAAATAAMVSVVLLDGASTLDRWWAAGSVAGLAAALAAAQPLLKELLGERAQKAEGAWVAVLPAGVLVVVAPTEATTALTALQVPVAVAIMLAVAVLLLRSPAGSTSHRAGAIWFAGTMLWTFVWRLGTGLEAGEPGSWYWLSALLVTLLLGGAITAIGARLGVGMLVVAGALVTAGSWWIAWSGGNLGTEMAALTLPVLGILAAHDFAGSRRIAAWQVTPQLRQLAVVLFLLPTFLPALVDYGSDGLVRWWDVVVMVLLLALLTAIGWRWRGGLTMAAIAAAIVVSLSALASLAPYPDLLPEVGTGVVALALSGAVFVAHAEGLVRSGRAALITGASVFLLPSYVIAVADPTFTLAWAAPRAVMLAAVLVGLVIALSRVAPVAAMGSGLAVLGLAAWWWGWFVADSAAAGVVEVWTVPWAVLATAGVALFGWLFPASAPRWPGYLVPGVLIVVLPSYVVALADASFLADSAAVRGLVLAAVLLGLVVVLSRVVPVAAMGSGLAVLGLAAWWWGWFVAGSAAAGVVEVWTVPWAVLATAGVALFAWLFPASAPRWPGYLVPAVLIVVLPSYVVAVSDPHLVAEFAVPRLVGLLVLASAATAAVWRYPRLAAGAGSAGLLLIAEWWGFWVADSQVSDVPEAWALPWALLATAGIALWTRSVQLSRSARAGMLLLPAAAALLISTGAAVITPLGVGDMGDDLRAVLVVLLLWAATVALRGRAALAAVAGAAAAAMTWYQLASVVSGRYSDAPPEFYTWPAAVALAIVTALVLRAWGRPVNTMLSIAPTLSIALLPTAVLAWTSGEAGWRVWVVLVAAGGLLVAGVAEKWAGAVYPSLLAIAIVVVPVLTKLAQDLPAYVPLTIVGALLLVVGARLEAVRRRGKELTHWGHLLH